MTRLPLLWPGLMALVLSSWTAAKPSAVFNQALNFEPVGTIPGPSELIQVQGRRAFMAADKTLRVIDISNPASPRSLGAYSFPTRINGFHVTGTQIYVAADASGLGILDVSDDGVPKLAGSLRTPGQAKNVALAGTKALVADLLSGIDIIDVSNPSRPIQVGSIFLEGFATDVTTERTLAEGWPSTTASHPCRPNLPISSPKYRRELSSRRPQTNSLKITSLTRRQSSRSGVTQSISRAAIFSG